MLRTLGQNIGIWIRHIITLDIWDAALSSSIWYESFVNIYCARLHSHGNAPEVYEQCENVTLVLILNLIQSASLHPMCFALVQHRSLYDFICIIICKHINAQLVNLICKLCLAVSSKTSPHISCAIRCV